jgi:cytoskeletal protein RodZ
MKTVGSILRETRLRKSLTLESVEAATRIRRKFLTALEADDFRSLPSMIYAKGFIKNYSEYLGLDSATVLAFFRRQIDDAGRASVLPKGVSEPLDASPFALTPGRFVLLLVVGLVGVFLMYFVFQYRRLQQPPSLTIDTPKNESVVSERKIDVTGTTDNDATVTINGISVLVRPDGKFFDQVALEAGVNTVTIVATSRYGKSAAVVRKVGLQQ